MTPFRTAWTPRAKEDARISAASSKGENLRKRVDERSPVALGIRRGGVGLNPRLQALHTGRSSDDGVTRSSGRGSEERRRLP